MPSSRRGGVVAAGKAGDGSGDKMARLHAHAARTRHDDHGPGLLHSTTVPRRPCMLHSTSASVKRTAKWRADANQQNVMGSTNRNVRGIDCRYADSVA